MPRQNRLRHAPRSRRRIFPLAVMRESDETSLLTPCALFDRSEFSLHFMALYMLSSLVRYRPQTWAHAISRTSISDAPADDQALALIEKFLDINSATVPLFVVTVLNPKEDRFRGS
jgi:hypothetical protein